MDTRSVKFFNWNDCERICNQLFNSNNHYSPFQTYEFLSIIKLGINLKRPFESFGYKSVNIVLYRDEVATILAPLYIKIKKEYVSVVLRGHMSSATNLDFLYSSNAEYDDFVFLMNSIRDKYKMKLKINICFDRIYYRSPTKEFCSQYFKCNPVTSKCVSIPVFPTWDKWYISLSKNARQNLRTSYNRLETDNLKINFKPYIQELPDGKVKKNTMLLFCRRLCEHSKLKDIGLSRILYLLKKNDIMTRALNNEKRFIGATIYINKMLIAYCQGLISNDGRAVIVRLSINIDYAKYSPGGLLINELMKEFEKNKKTRTIVEFDLARGDEKYKYTYGGVEYLSYTWISSL